MSENLTVEPCTSGAAAPRFRRVLAAVALAVGIAAPLLPITSAQAAIATPVAPVALPAAIEALAPYDGARLCSPTAKPGAVKLMALLLNTYPSSRNLGISRACTGTSKSEHKEGRAVDFGVRAWVPAEKAAGDSFVRWATATDSRGNTSANARRLGIMYMIWNDRIWTASRAASGWQPYRHPLCRTVAGCGNTYRHRDHVHISLSWPGARATTSFWTGRVGGAVAPAPAPAPVASSAGVATLAAYRTTTLSSGATGPAVTALQKALRMQQVTGNFGPVTLATVKAYQTRFRLPVTGVVAGMTWTTLQAELDREAKLIAPVSSTVLRTGSTGSAVRVLQGALNRPVDGLFGAGDLAAVTAFQTTHGITATGVVAGMTWSKLRGV